MKPLSFSVVVPTYQRRETVCETIRALHSVRHDGPLEIIVVVDGSTDGTASALSKIECKLPLRILEQQNRGLAAARNRGAAEANGDILLFLDDDMTCEPDLFEQHARSYRDGADAVVGEFSEPDAPFAGFRTPGLREQNGGSADAEMRTPFGIYGGHMSVRRSVFQCLDGFDEAFTRDGKYGYEDCDLAYRLLRKHFSVRRNPKAITRHRKRITAREYISRGYSSAQAELYLVQKHPDLSPDLIEWTGARRISKRLRLLTRVPLVPTIIAGLVAWLADAALRTSPRSSRRVAQLCKLAYTLAYWSTVRKNGGIPSV